MRRRKRALATIDVGANRTRDQKLVYHRDQTSGFLWRRPMRARKGARVVAAKENFNAARDRYTILTYVPSWASPDGLPLPVAVLFSRSGVVHVGGPGRGRVIKHHVRGVCCCGMIQEQRHESNITFVVSLVV